MCSLIVRTVRGLAQNLDHRQDGIADNVALTRRKEVNGKPAAAHNVTISAAADELSMNHRPGWRGISALSSTPSTMHFFPIF